MKKLFSIGVSLLLMLTMLGGGLSVAAADPTVSLPDVTGKPGETVSVVIRLGDNPGLISAKVKVGYDAAALEFVDVQTGDFPASGYSNGDPKKNPFVVNFCNGVATADYTAEVFATLQFRIKADAKAGKYPLTLTCDLEGDFFNCDWDTVYFSMDEGSVTVTADGGQSATNGGTTTGGNAPTDSTADTSAPTSTPDGGETPTQSGSTGSNTTTAADGADGVVGSTAPSDEAGNTTATAPADDGDGDGADEKANKKRAPLTPWLALVPIAAVILIVLTIHLVSVMRKKQDEPQ